ncbi:uncharacterized protein LOC124374291 isoform X3 [Homalodisca vitripennis]|uniref:uncharacterized protein LOC124374291 isoform X3 n=1 Tax=Homalodisca vitripennis TaxID=197043 RepID=UPI001EEA3245|nr:uncharacterized protein LOC124374291 isoform X3 [Homalodisca vitripennis]
MRQSTHAASRASVSQTPPVELRYPFGVQNDLGQVFLNSKSKDDKATTSGPPSPPVTRPSPAHTRHSPALSTSRLSLQSTSLQYSYASSGDLSTDAALLERAIRCNDTLRVKRILNLHHEKFPVNLHGSLLDKSSSDDSASQDVEILLRKSKTLIDKLDPADQYSSSSSSCRSPPASPLIFSNALHVAVDHGSVEVARLLLKYGLEPDQGGRLPSEPPASPRRPSGPQPPSRPCSPRAPEPQPSPSPPPPPPPQPPPPPIEVIPQEIPPTTIPCSAKYLEPTIAPSVLTPLLAARRVSWFAPCSPPDMSKKRRATTKSLPRQRSFSLEHNNQLLGPGGSWNTERRSVSLKSSPLISPRPPESAVSPAKLKATMPERSIFAELRRSSEIFKSILLNLSMKDAEQAALEDDEISGTPTEEPQIDVETLLAAHEQRKLATYQNESGFSSTSSSSSSSPSRSSRSSLSSPDEEDETEEVLGIGSPCVVSDKEGPLLRINGNIAPEKIANWVETYSRQYLFTLPALFLAVVRGNATLVYLLLKYGASVNFQDRLGNTALHLAVCQETVPWECVLDLLEHGARIAVPNKAGVRPADLCSPHLLARLQHHMLADCWQGLGDRKEPVPSGLVSGGSISISNANRAGNNPSRILRKLRTNRTESVEEAASCASGEQQLSSTGSVRSHGSVTRSPDIATASTNPKENGEGLKKRDSEIRKGKCKRKGWKEAARERQFSSVSEKQPVSAESGRSFHVLLSMSGNPECLGYLLRGILSHIPGLLRVLQQRSDSVLHRSMAALLHNILKTALEAYGDTSSGELTEVEKNTRRLELTAACCLLLKVCLNLIHGVHDLQYTAMVTINKVIDAAVVHSLGHVRVRTSTALHHPCNDKKQPLVEVPPPAPETPPPPTRSRMQKVSAKRLGSVWRHAASDQLEQVRKTIVNEEPPQEECIFDVLSSVHALSVLNILHNALTLYKRVIGSKQQCSPSQRYRHCSYHCLQILAARALLYMTEGNSVQGQLSQEPQLRILAAALDSTHDPQLLVLVLQIVATLALDPQHHKALLDNGLPDVLSQLLLPSDEWYYTNHSTKYARYVKHHVARILVYLGFQHRVNLRFCVYDILQDDVPPTPLVESVEDNYICLTSAPPSLVSAPDKTIMGVSVESAVINVLKTIETSLSQGTTTTESSTLHWFLSGSTYSHAFSKAPVERKPPTDPCSTVFVQTFLSCFPCVLSPIVLLRLLLHRLLTTAAHLQRWKSCASRSSFASASAHDVPRSPRSRASSTDTEPSTLRKRRKVNLTVDCSTAWAGEVPGTCEEPIPPPPSRLPRQSLRPSFLLDRAGSLIPRDSVSSASGLGLEPAMQATLFAFSHILRPAHSKDSLRSNSSDDSVGGMLPLPPFNLNLHNKPRGSFRFSSLRHSNKQRSKSQANITKVIRDSNGRKENPEQEILDFQKQLQNLPDFDSPEHPSGGSSDPATAVAEFLAKGGPHLRPRSRSMPRVTYETSRFLTLPEVSWPTGGGSFRLPRGRSAGALGFQAEHHGPCGPMVISSPVSTPVEERRVSSGSAGPPPNISVNTSGSRRSSLSPSDRNNRRRDSPACLQLEIPPWHRAILNFIEEWLRVSRVEIDRNPGLCRELRDFMSKVSTCGQPYQQWCAELRQEFTQLSKDPDIEIGDDLEETDREYCQLLKLVVAGDLPCSKEEAAALAGIQLRIEESWGRPFHHPLSPDDPNTLKPISEDKESFLLPVPPFGPGGNLQRPVSPLVEETEGEDGEPEPVCVGGGILKKMNTGLTTPGGPKPVHPQTSRTTANSILRKCYPSSNPQVPFLPSGHLEDCLPPCYHGAKTMAKLIKEQKRKLFHTSVYESEVQLKKLYIQTCRRLPAHGCKVYQVKELLRGKTKKKAARLLGVGPDKIVLLDNKTKILAKSQNTSDLIQWRTGGGRSHDRLQLEFRSSRWSLVVPSVADMRQVGLALWEILQELDCTFLEEHTLLSRFPNQDLVKRTVPLQVLHSAELEELQRLLHFPEEVALRLADSENELFYQVPPIDYLRQVTLDLGGSPAQAGDTPRASVRALVKRFNEVSSWVTHLIISQPTHEDRKCVLSCILRVALTCWNIGNFNGAMEIVAGLKSNKLKPFWLSITEKEALPVLEFLSSALLSVEYDRALGRALAMPECKVVPFFGAFLRDLRDILSTTPSLVVLAPSGEHTHLEFISDYNGEDHYFTRIGPGGLINLDKIYRTQAVMDRIASFHQHFHHRERDTDTFIDQISIHTSSIERSYLLEEKEDETSELDAYQPVQPLNNDHGVSYFPISAPHNNINHHTLQIMHHGTTVVHWDAEGGSRAALVYLRLERSCATLTWSRTAWSGLKTSGATSTADYSLSTNPEELIAPGLLSMGGEVASPGLEEGFLELSAVKEITLGARDKDRDLDLTNTLRRFNINRQPIDKCCLAIVYGANLSDNRVLFLLCPPSLCWTWYHGLCSVVRGLKRQLQQSDRRVIWLKEQYLQLYYEEGCCGPLTVDAIRVFGGRDWADPGKISGMSPPDNGTCKRGPSIKFKKKRSIGNIQALKQDLACSKMPELSELVSGGTLKRQGQIPGAPPSRSRSISSEMEIPRMIPQSPHGSSDHLDTSSPIQYQRDKMKSDVFAQIRNFRHGSITQETQLDFSDFVALFRSFSLRSRKDLRELFDQLAMSCRSLSDSSLNDTSAKNSPEHTTKIQQKIGLLTRNSSADLMEYKNTPGQQKKKIFDAIAASSIISNCAGVDTSKSQVITLPNFVKFLETKQMEHRTEEEVKELIQRHEPDPTLRSQHCLSFEGFARYMMDKENFAFVSERVSPDPNEMEYPLSHYYIASSHNTYLTGHQLKGESSVDLYSQVLLTGCRCVELDCWDGDDGSPLIYHGHTFTTKIAFRSVVEAINRSAFVTSPYPVILSIENHCSLQQQTRMAQIFLTVFGDKLVTKFLFEADFGDEPQLPSPLQLKYRILVKNKKLTAEIPTWPVQRGQGARGSQRPQQSGTGRASSIISNTSGGSVNDDFSDDDDDDDDDEDENIDGGTTVCPRTDSMSSHESAQKTPLRGQGKSPAAPQVDIDWSGYMEDELSLPKAKKQSSQIAKELSDLVIYVQAIKFRGLNTISPNSSVRCKQRAAVVAATTSSAMLKKGSGSSVTLASSGSPGASVVDSHSSHSKQRPNSNHPCYQTSSLNENSAKKLCRKQPHALVAHTETQLVRTYPAGMRIDSSNFNPVIFWAFGIQMVALNYQTDDAASHLNAAMFEQNGRCGYVPKPPVMRDRAHMMYRRFNPWEKEFDGLHSSHLILNLISGQYCCPIAPTTPPAPIVVEVELVGIPVDCSKQRTKNPTRNYVNPVFNETFFFKVMFRDLAFLRFNVLDQSTNHILTQRVMPLKCLRPGYRHVRLRSAQNQPLPLSSLFICSRTEEESLDGAREARGAIQEVRPDASTLLPGVKRRMFFLMVYGVVPDEPYTILKITQESTTHEVILQALTKAGVGSERAGDYVLVEEVARGWGGREKDMPASQRVLDPQERPLQAQAQWQGVGKFLLKRLGDDPSSRAWLSSIRSTRNVKQARTWDEADNFLVCVYNVSPEIPYAILKVPLTACAQDVLAQALVKARRLEDPVRFVLVEELEWQNGGNRVQRVLPDEENIFRTQAHWQTIGRFILKEREVRKSGTLRPALDRLSKGLSATLSDPTTTAKAKFPLSGLGRRASSREPVTTQREVHSEGETLSDDDGDLRTAVARLKRVSLRKLKVWKS